MGNEKTTWRKEISLEMGRRGESWDDVVVSPPDAALDREFDGGFGGAEGCAFTLWTKSRVYFPVVYDGSEWCESAPRNPCNHMMPHVGG